MTNKELKKWLKRCGSTDSLCDGCPFGAHELCFDEIKLAALALIKKQEKEINQLETECTLLDDELRNARQETINVLTKLKGNIKNAIDTYYNSQSGGYYLAEDVIDDVDELIEELIENAEDKS